VAAQVKIQPGDHGRLIVTFPYSSERVEKIKPIPGRQWEADRKQWTVPASNGMVERLIALFAGERVEVDPTLAWEEKATGAFCKPWRTN
jgi:integrase/recombinase XerD